MQTELFRKPKLNRATIKARVLEAIRAKPQTDDELARTLRWPSNTVRPRRLDLEREGQIVCVGRRPSRSGRACKVWGLPATGQ